MARRSVCILGISSVTQNSKRSLLLLSFPFSTFHFHLHSLLSLVGVAGFEPATLRLSSACSNQLSYTPFERCAWWRHGDSNPRPIACKATALPTELCPQGVSSKGVYWFYGVRTFPCRWEFEAKTELCATVSDTLMLRFLSLPKS